MDGSVNQVVWRWWDSLFHRLAGLQPLEAGETYLFFVTRGRYYGRPFFIDDLKVRRFSPIVELHMNNEMLFQVLRESKTPVSVAVRLLRETQRALPILARTLQRQEFESAKVLLGVTFIHRGIQKLGFQSLPIRNPVFRWMTQHHLRWVFRTVNPDANHVFRTHPESFVPKVVVMAKETLLKQSGVS